ncbi:MAG: 23S rRNA (uracil(1939)-C(5))-methyltransferase RlmD [Acetatifactor sp.]|nr:23S rRNA (uracil(1939)-C(5))-methyltransferase RlmD [Acetatifactor sp.]
MREKICPVSGKCGGCRWVDKPYEEQLQEKEKRFAKLMAPFCKPEPMIGMEQPAHYRNKVHAVFGEDRRHRVISGIYEAASHRIVPVDSCYIENEKADAIIVSIRKLLPSFKIRPYNEDTGYGLFRHVLIRTAHATEQIMVVLVLASPILPSKNNFVKALRKEHPEITTIVVNVNGRGTSMVLGEREQVIYGKGYIEDVLCGKTFRISPKSFYQVNPVQTEKLYGKALEYAQLAGGETVLDAYCGTGTMGIIAAGRAGNVIGVELNADAVRDARINAKRNGVENIQFYLNDAGKFLTDMAAQAQGEEGRNAGRQKGQMMVDVLLMDPPRAGSDEAFLSSVVRLGPSKVVYVSCNPETLIRDLKYLKRYGYQVKRAVGVDMFPFTEATEAVCLLEKRDGK